MQVAIIGLPSSGKTTLFNLLTDGGSHGGGEDTTRLTTQGKQEVEIRMARVPDGRVDYLSNMFQPQKTTYAQIQVTDVPGLSASEAGGGADSTRFLSYLRTVDAFAYVVRTFKEAAGALPVAYEIDPVNEIESLSLSLILADLQVVQNRVKRLESSKRRSIEEEAELALLKSIEAPLEDGKRLDRLGLSGEDELKLRGYALLTLKPVVVVANLSEEQFTAREFTGQKELIDYTQEYGMPLIELSAKIEREIQELPGTDREAFLSEYGISEPAISRLSKTVYQVLGLISFFTVGEDEVKAWPIPNGTVAKAAAGKIHSDIEKGFIRAEVIAFNDLKECGSVNAAKGKGLYRLEGKDYVVKDGDIIHFRFNKR